MKNQKFTQFLSCATMFAIMSSMTACGEKGSNGGNNNTERPVQTADELIKNSYASESIDTVPQIHRQDLHLKSFCRPCHTFCKHKSVLLLPHMEPSQNFPSRLLYRRNL